MMLICIHRPRDRISKNCARLSFNVADKKVMVLTISIFISDKIIDYNPAILVMLDCQTEC